MAGDWTSMHAIMQDLSVAQGGMPVIVDGIVTAHDRPPTPLIDDDIDEEYYQSMCTGDEYMKPDLGMIKEMLNMVRDKGISDGEDEFTSLKKPKTPDLLTTDPLPRITTPNTKSNKKTRPSRNIAMTSLLKLESERNALKLLNSEVSKEERVVEETVKDNSVLVSENKHALKLAPGSMFKRKLVPNSPQKKCAEVKTQADIVSPMSGEYKPSTKANEYYNKYMEQSRAKELMQEDIWGRLERQMKEIDAKRKMEKLTSTPIDSQSPNKSISNNNQHTDSSQSPNSISLSPNNISQSPNNISQSPNNISQSPINGESPTSYVMGTVSLAQHRHQLTGECVVCDVVTLRGYDLQHSSVHL